ncbi:MAG: LD-carboxypeptidase [Rhodobacter sp.]|nr:LD-carboxypeptidase [Rhodobacter sp.]
MKREVFDQFRLLAGSLGFKVKVFGEFDSPFGRLAADDCTRAGHLSAAFADEEVAAIICARGGYGSGRVLEHLPRSSFKDKILVGYSDITALMLHLQAQHGMITFHGPMAIDLVQKGNNDTLRWFLETLSGTRLSYVLGHEDYSIVRAGCASGPIYGGNLSVLEAHIGTESMVVPEGIILLLEDVGEFMYSLDRSLVHIRRAGLLDRASGVVISDLRLKDGEGSDNSLGMLLNDVLQYHFGAFHGPVVYGLPCGHTERQMTLPIGAHALLEVGRENMKISFESFWENENSQCIAA